MTLKQPLDASELAALSAYIQQNMVFLRNHRFLLPGPRIFLISFINGGLKGLIRVLCNRCLTFPPMMDTLQNMATRPALWILLVAIILMLVWLVR